MKDTESPKKLFKMSSQLFKLAHKDHKGHTDNTAFPQFLSMLFSAENLRS